ncbi:ABC transporter substrate-binding protein [Streptomyces angustmyceticus]|uniref:Peptide-binding protein n=1 Tax=Streptomyces angustmyceticus TaxID=285578 RepID=A0A5J4LI01_9ACTN|nr:ABC transporter substrate-binding protein [Streptomyces angustmyceticus]UAL70044.1 peptide-binding protein [Streptomyces angustmyceticus]GES33827.1 peptide-binding protein [Streptomyces angustmyceticus]
MNRKTLVLPALAGLLAPVLAACGSADGAGEGGDPIVVGVSSEIEATKAAPAPLDPAQAYDVDAWNMLRGTLQTLMRLPRTGNAPVPEAAESCGFRDTQNEQYRCTLRSGLKFSNGHALTAQDVKFSLDRMRTINNTNGPVSLLDDIDKIETPNDKEVVFHLRKPDATFPQKLATPAAAIVDGEVYPKGRLYSGFDVVGSGPYTLKTERKNNRITKATFTKSPTYKGGVKVKNEKVEMRFFAGSKATEQALRKGDVDLMYRGLSPDQIKGLENARDQHIMLQEMPGQEIRYLAFNTKDPAVSNKAVRKAMAQIVNRSELVRDVYSYTGDPLYSMVPTGLTGHINSFFTKYGNPSAAAARKTLQQANITTPVKFTLTYTTNHYGSSTAEEVRALQTQLNSTKLFDVKTKGVDSWQQFRTDSLHGKYSVYNMGWYADIPDPDNYIAPFIGKQNFLGSPYRNAKIESQLIPDSRQQSDRNAAGANFKQAQDIIADDVPLLPLWQGKQYVVARDDVTGIEWALNSSSSLQIWELGRGVAD